MYFACPAQYRPFVEAALAVAMADVGRDVKRRSDEDAVIRGLASIPDRFITPDETGTLIVMVTIPNEDALSALPDHMHAFTPITR